MKPPKSKWTWWGGWDVTTSIRTLTTTPPSSGCPTKETPPCWSSCLMRARWQRLRATSTRTTLHTGTTVSSGGRRCVWIPSHVICVITYDLKVMSFAAERKHEKVTWINSLMRSIISRLQFRPSVNVMCHWLSWCSVFPSSVDLFLPKFSISAAASLDETFKEMGITNAYSDDADFSGMSAEIKLKLSKVRLDGCCFPACSI